MGLSVNVEYPLITSSNDRNDHCEEAIILLKLNSIMVASPSSNGQGHSDFQSEDTGSNPVGNNTGTNVGSLKMISRGG